MNRSRTMKVLLALALAIIIAGPARAQSPGPASASATAGPTASVSPSAAAWRAAKIKQARDEIAERYAGRRRSAQKTLSDLSACVKRLREGQGRRNVEKAIVNLEAALAKADAHAAAGVYRKAFIALGRPTKAAESALKRCQSGAP